MGDAFAVFFQDGKMLGQMRMVKMLGEVKQLNFFFADPCVKMEPFLQKAFMN